MKDLSVVAMKEDANFAMDSAKEITNKWEILSTMMMISVNSKFTMNLRATRITRAGQEHMLQPISICAAKIKWSTTTSFDCLKL
jgi:hypothetical protein